MKKILLGSCILFLLLAGPAMAGSVTITFDLAHDNIYLFYANKTVQFSYSTTLYDGTSQKDYGAIAEIKVPPLSFPPQYVQPVTATIDLVPGRCINQITWTALPNGGGGPAKIPCTNEGTHTAALSQATTASYIKLYWDGSVWPQ
ncbi:MAG: hypothetical protein AB1921_12080 [Thermodesulfobacteriota bacterium]